MRIVDTINAVLRSKSGPLWSVSPSTLVYDAIEMMADKQIGAVLVTSEGKLVGMLSERDYARNIILKGRSSKETPVGEIMESPPITVTSQHTVDDCMQLITDHRVRHLPVVDGDRVVGIISIGDLVKWIMSAQEQTITHLENYIAGSY